jgi:hypothetical protein
LAIGKHFPVFQYQYHTIVRKQYLTTFESSCILNYKSTLRSIR